jgi:hypothetical protein
MPAADTIFIVGNLFTISSMDAKSQALAGGLFSTATRVRAPNPLPLHDAHEGSPSGRTDIHGRRARGHVCALNGRHGEQVPRRAAVARYAARGVSSRGLALLLHGRHRHSAQLLLAARARGDRWHRRHVCKREGDSNRR